MRLPFYRRIIASAHISSLGSCCRVRQGLTRSPFKASLAFLLSLLASVKTELYPGRLMMHASIPGTSSDGCAADEPEIGHAFQSLEHASDRLEPQHNSSSAQVWLTTDPMKSACAGHSLKDSCHTAIGLAVMG